MEKLLELQRTLAARHVTLVVVSKMQPLDKVRAVYDAGQRVFAENRVQDLLARYEALPKDIAWHLIGTLQRNKVKYVAPFVQLIHSVDSLELLLEIDRQAAKNGRVIDCLLQFHVAQEETKHGLSLAEAEELLTSEAYSACQHVRLCGVMGMATFTDDEVQVRAEFRELHQIFEHLKQRFFADAPHFQHRSMGMSGDWEIAVEEGSTMVRIGSLVFRGDT